ncbi:hypothetical protein [Nonomuraea jabiensis]|uniref:hypothetical protein n=1 Tax=Nonomuraea jabiensis TaxID=882448 RepID=UPI003D709A88
MTVNGARGYFRRPQIWTGQLTPEELEEIGPDATPPPPASWTRDEYRALMEGRGVRDTNDSDALGIDGYLALAEEVGWLHKRPNTMPLIDDEVQGGQDRL